MASAIESNSAQPIVITFGKRIRLKIHALGKG